jgi:hypothetical protein
MNAAGLPDLGVAAVSAQSTAATTAAAPGPARWSTGPRPSGAAHGRRDDRPANLIEATSSC